LFSHRTSIDFAKDIELNLDKSHGSYVYDDRTQSEFLDFFSFFASNGLGYSHPAYETAEFTQDILRYSKIKVSSGRIYTKYFSDFIEQFHDFAGAGVFEKYFFIHGGALAVENALKVAFDWKAKRVPASVDPTTFQVIGFKGAFHGTSGYMLSITGLPAAKVVNFPKLDWPRFEAPLLRGDDASLQKQTESHSLQEIEKYLCGAGKDRVAAILLEPIQCTAGDFSFSASYLAELKKLCREYRVALIFDEIQTGFGVTGNLWYWQELGVVPDILVFGKKAQVCGLAASADFSEAFSVPHRLNVTWDGHIVDVVRSKHLIHELQKSSIIQDVKRRGKWIADGLRKFPELKNVRNTGLLIAFDFENPAQRDAFYTNTYANKVLVNLAGDRTIRLRPNLYVSDSEIVDFIQRVGASLATGKN